MRSLFVSIAALLTLVQAATLSPLLGRDLLDICASINVDLVVPDALGILTAVGVIDICLCLSALPVFLQTNVVALLAVDISSEPVVTNIITQLIEEAAGSQKCTYPPHSKPACVNGNPCAFTCSDGYVPSPPTNPTECVCVSPNQLCNGVCTSAKTCPSNSPSRRQTESWYQKRMACDFGYTACGATGLSAYECVDTRSDLESCGGCSNPLNEHSPRGRDCSSIPGVADVSCRNGACRIYECLPGYRLSHDSQTCYDEDQFSLAKALVQKYRMASGFI